MKVKPESLVRTDVVIYSEWEGITEDNRPVYIRFKNDNLSVRVGKPSESQKDMFMSAVLSENQLSISALTSKPFNGFLDNQEMHQLLVNHSLSSKPEYILTNIQPIIDDVQNEINKLIIKELDALSNEIAKKPKANYFYINTRQK